MDVRIADARGAKPGPLVPPPVGIAAMLSVYPPSLRSFPRWDSRWDIDSRTRCLTWQKKAGKRHGDFTKGMARCPGSNSRARSAWLALLLSDRLPPSEQVYRMGELLRESATAEDILAQTVADL